MQPVSHIYANGKLKLNVAPPPSPLFPASFFTELFFAQILPLCASIMPLHMYSPSPVPLSDLVTNLPNRLDKVSESIPVPVSLTLTIT
ncbi:MAG: hypothetical protein WBL67_06760 [Nitrososphaeraceae archaeon]